jgi:hypothetical protein
MDEDEAAARSSGAEPGRMQSDLRQACSCLAFWGRVLAGSAARAARTGGAFNYV